jgi:hypothetical protein
VTPRSGRRSVILAFPAVWPRHIELRVRTKWKFNRILNEEVFQMLWLIFIILLVMWMLGMVTSYTFGGFLHLLLVIAIAAVLIRVIQGRRPI